MTLPELNQSKIAELPVKYDGYFPDFIAQIFNNYISATQALSPHDGERHEYSKILRMLPYIRELASAIHTSICEYYKGNVSTCYNNLGTIISQELPLFRKLITPPKNRQVIESVHPRGLFRLRRIKSAHPPIPRKELFHIPFECRHNATTARYSVPGLPCLYLSSSLYIAKKELEIKRLENIYVSRYIASDEFDMRILDLSYQPQLLGRWGFQYFEDIVYPRMVFWPLIAACSVAVKHPKATFKPEYIVPQFLFQIGSSLFDFDGIRYFSSKVSCERPVNINYAIKVKNIVKADYCSWLRRQFLLTDPILWNEIKNVPHHSNTDLLITEKCKIYYKGKFVDYKYTPFDLLERKIETLPSSKI